MKFNRRELRALAIVAGGGQIRRISNARYMVSSQSGQGSYLVAWDRGRWKCDCADFLKGSNCKHVKSIRWALLLPHLLAANEVAVAGLDEGAKGDQQPVVMCNGRAVSVQEARTFYRELLELMGDTRRVYPAALPRPRVSVNRLSPNATPGRPRI